MYAIWPAVFRRPRRDFFFVGTAKSGLAIRFTGRVAGNAKTA
jgi:hypothetical protein